MNNLKKTAMGLMVGAMAIGFSAFTNAPTKAKFASFYYINDPSSSNYIRYTGSGTPETGLNCEVPDEFTCVVESSTDLGDSFPKTDAASLGAEPVEGSSLAFYQD